MECGGTCPFYPASAIWTGSSKILPGSQWWKFPRSDDELDAFVQALLAERITARDTRRSKPFRNGAARRQWLAAG